MTGAYHLVFTYMKRWPGHAGGVHWEYSSEAIARQAYEEEVARLPWGYKVVAACIIHGETAIWLEDPYEAIATQSLFTLVKRHVYGWTS